MGNLPLPISSGAGVFNFGIVPPASEPAQAQSGESSKDVALLGVLREAATTGSLSAEAILNALADAARVLSGADGIAIASRKDGAIVCRARSGDMAPGLGAPLSSDSGISGECLRTASIQICSDASTDARVDSEVCRALGICSVAVVPLRWRMGIFGILEAFSARPNAFEEEQIDALRSLAEIAELAYERERSAANPAPTTSPVRAALFSVPARDDRDQNRAPAASKRYWMIGGISLLLFAMAWIARISWRQTGAEIAARASTVQNASTSAAPSSSTVRPVGKPEAAILAYSADRPRSRVVENAAAIDPAPESPVVLTPSNNPSVGESTRKARPVREDSLVSAPPVAAAVSSLPGEIPKFAPETAPLPRFGGAVSRGSDAAPTVLKRVNPIYPQQAKSHGIWGDVILDATVAQNGSVRSIKVISGPALLCDAAVVAMRQWRFLPALLNGKPVEVQQRVTIKFKLP